MYWVIFAKQELYFPKFLFLYCSNLMCGTKDYLHEFGEAKKTQSHIILYLKDEGNAIRYQTQVQLSSIAMDLQLTPWCGDSSLPTAPPAPQDALPGRSLSCVRGMLSSI
jgi:hypothetical protein